jgi:phage anti-repressor protein
MNEIQTVTNQTPIEIALGIDENGMTTARKLYEFLEMNKTQFSRWAKTNIENNEFYEEGTDWIGFDIVSNGNECKDYKLTTDFAKHLSMESHSGKGKEARNYFLKVEDKLKETTINLEGISTEMKALIMQDKKLQIVVNRVNSVDKDLQTFKKDLPLLGCDMDRITTAVKKMGVKCLGGKESNAYKDKPLRTKVYSDIYEQLKRQFGVSSYKSIKRNQLDMSLTIIEHYALPMILQEEIKDCNAQITMK